MMKMMKMMKMTMYQTLLHCIETVDWLTARVSDLQNSLTCNYTPKVLRKTYEDRRNLKLLLDKQKPKLYAKTCAVLYSR